MAAEAIVEKHYLGIGCQPVARRWRGAGGEIDLILRDDTGLIFVEVKKSKSFARAALRVSDRQIARIYSTAEEFLSTMPDGQNSAARFDVALVNSDGQVHIIENAFGF